LARFGNRIRLRSASLAGQHAAGGIYEMFHRRTNRRKRVLMASVAACMLTVSVAGSALAAPHSLEVVLFGVSPETTVHVVDDPAAERASERAAKNAGLSVFPLTRGDLIIGDTSILMQGPSLEWLGGRQDVQLLVSEEVVVSTDEENRFEWGFVPPSQPGCHGPQFTPVFEEVLGYAIDADAYREGIGNRVDTHMLFEYAVNTVDGSETHRFSVHRVGPTGNWAGIVKAMPDGGHLILFHRLAPLE